jgi:hypothetical protein
MAFYPNAPLPDTNARQVAQTIRMPSTALLTIDSEDRYDRGGSAIVDFFDQSLIPTSAYNFTIRKNESLMPGFMTRLGVSEVVFPWTIPNINTKTNKIRINSFTPSFFNENTIELPQGFYTPAQLAATITDLVQACGDPQLVDFEMTYGQPVPGVVGTQPNFFWTTGSPTIAATFLPMIPNSAEYPWGENVRQLFQLLGQQDSVISAPSDQNVGNFTLCQGIRYVDIVCNQLTNSQAQKDQTSQTIARDALCRIYVAGMGTTQSTVQPDASGFCPPGCAPTVLYRNFTMPKQIQWIPNQNIPGFLQFQVYDDNGDLLDEAISETVDDIFRLRGAGATDWSMTLLVSEN